MDLHLHTPASIDYKQQNVTYLDFLKKAEERNLDIIAFADHNTATGYARYLEEVESLELLERLNRLQPDERNRLEEYRRLQDKILILPGFEFTATLGFHILGIFPPETSVRELEHLLLLLRVPPDKLDQGSGEVGATSDVLTAYRMINEAGGLVIAAHANSSHGVAMPGFDFGGQTRIAYTQDASLHALEVTDLDSRSRRRTAMFFNGSKPEYPRRMHAIQGSDAHKLDFDARYKNEMGVGDRATEILLDDLAFEAIKEVFLGNDFARTRPSRLPTEEPFDPIREARETGDTLVQSFHERMHDRRAIDRSILEDVVALANTNGGTIYIGASGNARQAVLGVDRPEQATAELRGAVSKEVTPPLEVQVDILKSQGKSVLQAIVPRGSDAPYALEGSYIYVRSENETGLAHRDEIVQLVRDALAVESAALAPLPVPEKKEERAEPAEPGEPIVQPAPTLALPVQPPRTGVEIVSSEVRKSVTYYSVRDLRNGRVVQNVTRASARRLWQYAIEECERSTCDPAKIAWVGNIGICKTHKRGGKTRYDLAQRVDGKMFIYYGVTDDGIHGAWRTLIEGESGAEIEDLEAEAHAEINPPSEIPVEPPTAAAEQETEHIIAEVEPEEEKPVALLPGSFEPIPQEIEEQPSTEQPEVVQAAPVEEQPPAEQPVVAQEERVEQQAIMGEPAAMSQAQADHQPSAAEPAAPQAQAEGQPVAVPEEHMPAHEATAAELERSTDEAGSMVPSAPAKPSPEPQALPEPQTPPEQPAQQVPPSTQPAQELPRRTRAQEWREILDRAIAEARAAQQAARVRTEENPATTPQIKGEEAALSEDRAAAQGQARTTEIIQSDEQSSDAERAHSEGDKENHGADGDRQG